MGIIANTIVFYVLFVPISRFTISSHSRPSTCSKQNSEQYEELQMNISKNNDANAVEWKNLRWFLQLIRMKRTNLSYSKKSTMKRNCHLTKLSIWIVNSVLQYWKTWFLIVLSKKGFKLQMKRSKRLGQECWKLVCNNNNELKFYQQDSLAITLQSMII